MLSDKEIDDLVETIMRYSNTDNYDAYTDEETRAKWRKFLKEEEVKKDETVVRE